MEVCSSKKDNNEISPEKTMEDEIEIPPENILQKSNPHLDLKYFKSNPTHLVFDKIFSKNAIGDTGFSLCPYEIENHSYLACISKKRNYDGSDLISTVMFIFDNKCYLTIYDLEKNQLIKEISYPFGTSNVKIKYYKNIYSGESYLVIDVQSKMIILLNITKNFQEESRIPCQYVGPFSIVFLSLISYDLVLGLEIMKYDNPYLYIYDEKGIEKVRTKYRFINVQNIETYYLKNKIYLLISNNEGIFLYNYLQEEVETHFWEDYSYHNCSILLEINKQLIIIDGNDKGIISLWDVESKQIITKYKTEDYPIWSMVLWNERYLIISGGYDNDFVRIINLESSSTINYLPKKMNDVRCIRKVKVNESEYLLTMRACFPTELLFWKVSK